MLQSAGFQDLGKTAVKIAATLGAGKAASEQLSGEAARHRAHRANLMGASVKQATAAQVLLSSLIFHLHAHFCVASIFHKQHPAFRRWKLMIQRKELEFKFFT